MISQECFPSGGLGANWNLSGKLGMKLAIGCKLKGIIFIW